MGEQREQCKLATFLKATHLFFFNQINKNKVGAEKKAYQSIKRSDAGNNQLQVSLLESCSAQGYLKIKTKQTKSHVKKKKIQELAQEPELHSEILPKKTKHK